jgi:metal-responsive CopG/Arc/MetJ family transcriptional regulator
MVYAKSNRNGNGQKPRISITLPEDHYDKVMELAEKKKVSLAWVVRDAVERYLVEEKIK